MGVPPSWLKSLWCSKFLHLQIRNNNSVQVPLWKILIVQKAYIPVFPFLRFRVWSLKYIHTLRVHYAHAAANLNSGYSKYAKAGRVHYFCTIALRTSRAVLTRAWASRRVDLRKRRVDSFLSRLNVVQKETMWSLILYVVCVCMCMYVVIFAKIDHCIHIHWCIPMGLGHNDPWVESHMWPQQMWGQRSSRGQWPLVQVLAKRFPLSTYFDVFSWDLDTMILG